MLIKKLEEEIVNESTTKIKFNILTINKKRLLVLYSLF